MVSVAAPLSIWHLWLDETPRPGWANMAIDHALLERAQHLGEGWLRLYQWAPHCLSFGRHEPATRRYAVAVPSVRFGSLPAAYLEIHGMLADAFRGLGATASLARPVRTPPLDTGPCFSQPAGGEIMIEGRKVVGSAQLRQGGALLQHGSILLEDSQRLVLDLMRGASIAQSSPGPRPALTTPGGAGPFRCGEVAEAVTRAAEVRWPAEWNQIADPEPVLRAASSLYPHYRSTAWTWAR